MERSTFGVLVTIYTGEDMPVSVYGAREIGRIMEAGAKALNYKAEVSTVEAPIKVSMTDVTYQLVIDVEKVEVK